MSLTKFQADQIRLLLDAHESGKEVQQRVLSGGTDWRQSPSAPPGQIMNVLYGNYEYRIKPEQVKVWVNVYPPKGIGCRFHHYFYFEEKAAQECLKQGGKTICVEFDND